MKKQGSRRAALPCCSLALGTGSKFFAQSLNDHTCTTGGARETRKVKVLEVACTAAGGRPLLELPGFASPMGHTFDCLQPLSHNLMEPMFPSHPLQMPRPAWL